jgi:hypothetical protein
MTKMRIHFGLGITSILVIFAVLCLVTFSVLSYASARADSRLSEGVVAKTAGYYQAGNLANEKLAALDGQLETAFRSSGNEAAYYAAAEKLLAGDPDCSAAFENGTMTVSFSEAVSDSQTLQVTVQILYPDSADPWYYKITNWETEYTGDWNPDYSVHVAGG